MPKKQLVQVDDRELTISNLDKVLFPETGFTKGEVIAFYSKAADSILPHLRQRPLTLKRYPDGVAAEHFYEKNAPSYTPGWVERFSVPRESGGSDIRYILCNDRATLVWVTSLADIEKHVLLSHAPDLNRPTSLVFDLDPGEPANILDCGEIALKLRQTLQSLGLESFVKVSGSKGLHVNVPLNTEVTYEATQPFAKTIAELLQKQMPDRVVSDMAKRLRKGKVLIDWSQNSDFKTTVAVYALRAKEKPWISMPITWEELARALKRKNIKSLYFSPSAAVKRLKRVGDLFAPVLSLEQQLPEQFVSALKEGPVPKLATWQRNRGKVLQEYTAKRDLSRTPEPAARKAIKANASKAGGMFVVQKHQASHLHYDFRLEMEGVLRSWAVPKGPPTTLRQSRLAMHVEDHPLEYGKFEGTIPPGNYGAGTVMVWDFGTYEDITGNATGAFYAGKMHIRMKGKKLTGEWILVKDRRSERDNWLLIKAGESMPEFSKKADDTSALTGRSLMQIVEAKGSRWESDHQRSASVTVPSHKAKTKAAKAKVSFIEPMQCKPVARLPEGPEWLYELKLDGYRCEVVKNGDDVQLVSRNGKSLNARFPAIAEAFRTWPVHTAIVDGEVVMLDEQGRPSFQLLQNSATAHAPAYYFAFDLLQKDSASLVGEKLEQRRRLLQEALAGMEDPIRVSAELTGSAVQVTAAVMQLQLEGVVSKRRDSVYEPGERTGSWCKFRTNNSQEFVIGGFIPGTKHFDALLVGYYSGEQLIYCAKVRNGFVPRVRGEIGPRVKKLKVARCPFSNLPEKKGGRWGESITAEKMKECVWVKPELVCQVAFVEWTSAGHLRHCSFAGMREDKPAAKVVREI
jgi:bifunctional non-homologous end joining protein LigD